MRPDDPTPETVMTPSLEERVDALEQLVGHLLEAQGPGIDPLQAQHLIFKAQTDARRKALKGERGT